MIEKDFKMKVVYTSPVFTDLNGTARKFSIPVDAVTTYAKRDAALLKLIALGGINAEATPEVLAIRKTMLSAKRKIERQGWSSVAV